MINLKIQLTSEQFKEFAIKLNQTFARCKEDEKFSYLDYYNIRSLMKRLLDKLYNLQTIGFKPKKKVTFNININEYESLKKNINYFEFNQPAEAYSLNIFQNILFQLDKQKVNLKMIT